jgi:hypothetical protein
MTKNELEKLGTEKLCQMLLAAAEDFAKVSNCTASQYLNDISTKEYSKEEKVENNSQLTETTIIKQAAPRKWTGWKDKDYIPGRMLVYGEDIFKNHTPHTSLIAIENGKNNWDELDRVAKMAISFGGNKHFTIAPEYCDKIEDIIPTDKGLKVLIKDKKYKKEFKNSIYPYGVYGDKKDLYSWEYVEIPFELEIEKK